MVRILWVEDQHHWINKFKPVLENTDFGVEAGDIGSQAVNGQSNEVITFHIANAARQHIAQISDDKKPDIALLDAHMNGNDGAGFLVSRSLHSKWPELPIIFLSEHSGTEIEQTALEEIEAQDFIAKHQRNIEEVLCWRIKSVLRQRQSKSDSSAELLQSGDLKIDLATWEVFWRGKKLMNPTNSRRPLAPMPRKILHHLVESSPRPLSTIQMAERLDADPEKFSYANYRQHIKTLRHSFDQIEGGKGHFVERCKIGEGIVTFGDLGAYCWKQD